MPDQETSKIKIHATLVEKINFACHQSAFAVLPELRIENLDEEQDLSDLSIVLEASPGFVKSKIWTVDRLAAGGLLTMKDRDLELDGGFLFGLTESMRGTVTIRVMQSGEALMVMLRAWPQRTPWLAAKLVGLCFYIGFGVLAFRRTGRPALRAGFAVLALGVFAYIVMVAVTKTPLP